MAAARRLARRLHHHARLPRQAMSGGARALLVHGEMLVSLLDTGTEAVRIYPSIWAADEDGNLGWRPGMTGIDVRALVQPISSTPLAVNGQQVVTLARIITPPAPARPWDRIEWDGRT